MIRVTVLYPAGEGRTFDMDYYLTKHIPMVQARLGAALKGVTVDQGLAGGAPDAPPTYVCVCQLAFESVAAFDAAFAPHAAEVMTDIPKYTNVQPVIQVGEVRI
jgi:uncharacterized protein (TIGR02118 family)